MIGKDKIAMTMALALLCVCSIAAANAQSIERVYREAVPGMKVEDEQSRINVVPRVIEQHVLVQPSVNFGVVNESSLPKRSNYSKRLGDMLEQLSFAYERGWLSLGQYANLKSWEASVAMEELLLRQRGNGVIRSADVDRFERHMNGLAYTINREISEGSKVANLGANSP